MNREKVIEFLRPDWRKILVFGIIIMISLTIGISTKQVELQAPYIPERPSYQTYNITQYHFIEFLYLPWYLFTSKPMTWINWESREWLHSTSELFNYWFD